MIGSWFVVRCSLFVEAVRISRATTADRRLPTDNRPPTFVVYVLTVSSR